MSLGRKQASLILMICKALKAISKNSAQSEINHDRHIQPTAFLSWELLRYNFLQVRNDATVLFRLGDKTIAKCCNYRCLLLFTICDVKPGLMVEVLWRYLASHNKRDIILWKNMISGSNIFISIILECVTPCWLPTLE